MLEQLTDLGQSVFAGGQQLDLLIEGCASFSLTVLPSLLSDIFLCRASVPQCAANCCKEKERGLKSYEKKMGREKKLKCKIASVEDLVNWATKESHAAISRGLTTVDKSIDLRVILVNF